MPELYATRDFTYMTRRLKAGDKFQPRNGAEERILTKVLGKATYDNPRSRKRAAAVPAPQPLPEAIEVPPVATPEAPAPEAASVQTPESQASSPRNQNPTRGPRRGPQGRRNAPAAKP